VVTSMRLRVAGSRSVVEDLRPIPPHRCTQSSVVVMVTEDEVRDVVCCDEMTRECPHPAAHCAVSLSRLCCLLDWKRKYSHASVFYSQEEIGSKFTLADRCSPYRNMHVMCVPTNSVRTDISSCSRPTRESQYLWAELRLATRSLAALVTSESFN
jgi:hypothetical protein